VAALSVLASAAGAYNIPGTKPGTPGGPPTKPTPKGPAPKTAIGRENRAAAERAAHSLGVALAGLTNLELADHGPFTIRIDLPKPGKVDCGVFNANFDFGNSAKVYGSGGGHQFEYNFTIHGEATLKDFEGKHLRLGITCSFRPKGSSEYIGGNDQLVTLD
jgi:hypothetical protein